MELLGRLLGRLGGLLGCPWGLLGSLEGLLGGLGGLLGRLGGLLGRLGRLLGRLGPSWGLLGPSWGPLGPSWGAPSATHDKARTVRSITKVEGKFFTLRVTPPAHSEALPRIADGTWQEETHIVNQSGQGEEGGPLGALLEGLGVLLGLLGGGLGTLLGPSWGSLGGLGGLLGNILEDIDQRGGVLN